MVKVGCGRADCVSCAGVVTKRRGRVVLERLLRSVERARAARPSVRDPRMWAVRTWTLTLPPELLHLAETPAGISALRRAAWELVQAHGAQGACIIPHPVGDTCACGFRGDGPHNLGEACRPKWHPHVNVLWWKSGPSRLKSEDLNLARRRWRGFLWELSNPRKRKAKRAPVELEAVGGAAYWAGRLEDGASGLAQMHAQVTGAHELGRLAFRADYNARSFPGWSAWAPKWVQWFGEYVKAAAPPAEPCSRCGEKERELAVGRDNVVDRLQHLEAHQETGPPLLERLDDGHEIPTRDLAPALPGDKPWRIPFAHFAASMLVDVLGIPLEDVERRLELDAARERARELVRMAEERQALEDA